MQLDSLERIHIQGYAEPLYKDIVFEVLDWLDFSIFKKKVWWSMITNGMYVNEKTSNRWIESADKTTIMVSIDAGSRETYKNKKTYRIVTFFARARKIIEF